MQDDKARHRVPYRAVLYEGSSGDLARHMEVHRIVPYPAAFSELIELNSLNLKLLEALSEDNVPAEVGRRVGHRRDSRSLKINDRSFGARTGGDTPRQGRP